MRLDPERVKDGPELGCRGHILHPVTPHLACEEFSGHALGLLTLKAAENDLDLGIRHDRARYIWILTFELAKALMSED